MKGERKSEASGPWPVASERQCVKRSADAATPATTPVCSRGLHAPYSAQRHAKRANFPGPWPLASGPSRRVSGGFTLVELMVTMAIIAILGAAMAYAVAGAAESAKKASTRSLIAKLHALVMQKYESYRTRRLPIAIPPSVIDPKSGKEIPTPYRAIAKVRCDAMRQLMRMEMPERWTDVIDDPQPITVEAPGAPGTDPASWPVYFDADPNKPAKTPAVVTMQRTSSNLAYLARYRSLYGQTATIQDPSNDALQQQSAKCLYLLITMGLDETDVLENFSQQDIAILDSEGSQGFLDAWGHPIWFLRWAPGLVSALQPDAPDPNSPVRDQRMRDQTDPTGIYGSPQPGKLVLQPATDSQANGPGRATTPSSTFALYPLIFSAGPDGNYDLTAELLNPPQGSFKVFHYVLTNPQNNPFASVTDSSHFPCPAPPGLGQGGGPIGAPFCDPGRPFGTADNITNQSIGER